METRADRRAVGRAAGRAAAVCLSLIVLAGCGAAARSSTATQAEGPVSSEPQVLTIKATEFSFGAPTLRVQVNRPVRLVMENGGAIEHDVRAVKVPARDIKAVVEGHGHAGEVAAHAAPGTQAWVEFTPTRKGTYQLECTIAGHKDAGMKGTLVVE